MFGLVPRSGKDAVLEAFVVEVVPCFVCFVVSDQQSSADPAAREAADGYSLRVLHHGSLDLLRVRLKFRKPCFLKL